MDFGTAASIGIGLIKHRDGLGSALGGLAGISKMGGEGFAKIAEKFHLPKGLTQQITNAIDENSNPKNTSGVQVLASMRYFDADKNGEITKEELNQGLTQLRESGLTKSADAAKLYQMGDMMLKNYDKVSQLDGEGTSVSYKDMGKLLNQDGKLATLSPDDWQKLNA
ncbi:MAG: hypothetical protein K0Q50_2189 [Vampirovibrio sp.]|jgi:hypothetical protein|nr:hypothetical protein [Vampirovibrio sp.]